MSTKDATNLVPKWKPGDNIVPFCKKIENAWEYCRAEDFDEKKFCQILRLQLPADAAEIFDNMEAEKQSTVKEVANAIKLALDKQKSEYMQEFAEVTKQAAESYNAYALRVKRLYLRGTGTSSLSAGEKVMLVETFLNGLPSSESTTLRLVASDAEMISIDDLSKRAARVRSRPSKNHDEINALREEFDQIKTKIENQQSIECENNVTFSKN